MAVTVSPGIPPQLAGGNRFEPANRGHCWTVCAWCRFPFVVADSHYLEGDYGPVDRVSGRSSRVHRKGYRVSGWDRAYLLGGTCPFGG